MKGGGGLQGAGSHGSLEQGRLGSPVWGMGEEREGFARRDDEVEGEGGECRCVKGKWREVTQWRVLDGGRPRGGGDVEGEGPVWREAANVERWGGGEELGAGEGRRGGGGEGM